MKRGIVIITLFFVMGLVAFFAQVDSVSSQARQTPARDTSERSEETQRTAPKAVPEHPTERSKKPKITGSMIPMSGSTSTAVWQDEDNNVISGPAISLKVKLLSGDFAKWGSFWVGDEAVPLNFKWEARIEDIKWARWEVSTSPFFTKIIKSQKLTPVPPWGQPSQFSIDFSKLNEMVWGATCFVRVVAGDQAYYVTDVNNPTPPKGKVSPSVSVRLSKEGSFTTFDDLPKLWVVFDKIVVTDDSDDLSDGDLHFGFWVHDANPQYHNAQVGTGGSTKPKLTFAVEMPPPWVSIRVYGFDNDDPEWMPVGPFIVLLSDSCGGGMPAPGDECADGDIADASKGVPTGIDKGNSKPVESEMMYVYGPSLKFKVYYRYWLGP